MRTITNTFKIGTNLRTWFCTAMLVIFSQSLQAIRIDNTSIAISFDISVLKVQNVNVAIYQSIDDFKTLSISMRSSGGLSFISGSSVKFGEPLLDASNNLVYNSLGIPLMRSRMSIVEEANSNTRGADNHTSSTCRIRGNAQVKYFGVDYLIKNPNTTDFSVAGNGRVEFHDTKVVIESSSNTQRQVFANPNIWINGLTIDQKRPGVNGTILRFTARPNFAIKNLELVDNNPSSNSSQLELASSVMSATPFEINQLKARNIGLPGASATQECHLINTRGTTHKSQESSGVLKGYRDFSISVLDGSTKQVAKGLKLYIQRKGPTKSYRNSIDLGTTGATSLRLLEFQQNAGQSLTTIGDSSNYELAIFSYKKQLIAGDHKVRYTNADGTNSLLKLLSFDDQAITQSDTNVVKVYSTLDNLDQLYDRTKYWKTKPGNASLPTVDELLLTEKGGHLEVATGWNLKLDKSLSSALVIDEATKTIKVKTTNLQPGQFVKKLRAPSGTISVTSDEELTCIYTDKDRDSYVSIVNMGATDNVKVKDGSTVLFQEVGNFGFPYKSQSGNYEVVVNLTDGTEFMRLFDRSQTGVDNRFSISFDPTNNTFTDADRKFLFGTAGNTINTVEGDQAVLQTIQLWLYLLNKRIQTKP